MRFIYVVNNKFFKKSPWFPSHPPGDWFVISCCNFVINVNQVTEDGQKFLYSIPISVHTSFIQPQNTMKFSKIALATVFYVLSVYLVQVKNWVFLVNLVNLHCIVTALIVFVNAKSCLFSGLFYVFDICNICLKK